MTAPGPLRRCACTALAIGLAALLFHGALAAAVVTRGDDALRTGDLATALRSYRKALQLDPGSVVAADRLAFQLALTHRPPQAAAGIAVASAALLRHPAEPPLLADRAFGELVLRDWPHARIDFARAGALARDARYDYLSARLALRLHDRDGARAAARAAVAADPAFAPARALLRSEP